MTVASGTRRGSADNTPSTSVQMTISAASNSAPKIEAGEVAAIAAERRLHTVLFRGNEAGDDECALEVAIDQVAQACARVAPFDGGSQLPPLDDDDTACVDPLHRAAAAAALLEEAVEKLRRPDLAVTGDEIGHVVCSLPREFHGVEDPLQVVTVAVEAGEIQPRGLRGQQRLGNRRVASTQRDDFGAIAVVLPLGKGHEPQ